MSILYLKETNYCYEGVNHSHKGTEMAYNYNPLWETMKKQKISTYYLIKNGINPRIIHKLKHNQNVNVETIHNICNLLNQCSVEEVVEITFKEQNKKE